MGYTPIVATIVFVRTGVVNHLNWKVKVAKKDILLTKSVSDGRLRG